jgi:aspartyl-tRNA synthetase
VTDLLGNMKRTHYCEALRDMDIDKTVVLMGWVQHRRDHGGVIFVDLRDRDGITQVVFNPQVSKTVHEKAQEIRSEYVLGGLKEKWQPGRRIWSIPIWLPGPLKSWWKS